MSDFMVRFLFAIWPPYHLKIVPKFKIRVKYFQGAKQLCKRNVKSHRENARVNEPLEIYTPILHSCL
jgi:hypothetical protein